MKVTRITVDALDNGDTVQMVFEGNDMVIKHDSPTKPLFIDTKTLEILNIVKAAFSKR